MLFVVKLDVAVQIVPELVQPPVRFGVQLFDDPAKDAWQQVFSPKRERRGDRTRVIRFNDLEGLGDEPTDRLADIRRSQG